MDVQWYPGHMTKARRMMEENIRLVDLVIELLDARIPLSSRNPDIDALCAGKGRVVLLCKADLADPEKTDRFLQYFREKGILAAAVDAREQKAKDLVQRSIQEAGRDKLARDRARGIVGRPLRAMVAGIPNVGKSTFINSFAGRASTKTGNKPGVTRGKQWIRLGGGVELLDTPGILWPKFDNPETGMRLALVGAVRDEILDKEELALWLLDLLRREYPGAVEAKYLAGQDPAADLVDDPSAGAMPAGTASDLRGRIPRDDPDPSGTLPAGAVSESVFLLERIARARRLLMKGGAPDTARAAAMLLDDCKNGRIGRISLEGVQEARLMEEEQAAASKAAGQGGASAGPAGRSGRDREKQRGKDAGQERTGRRPQEKTDDGRGRRTAAQGRKDTRGRTDAPGRRTGAQGRAGTGAKTDIPGRRTGTQSRSGAKGRTGGQTSGKGTQKRGRKK